MKVFIFALVFFCSLFATAENVEEVAGSQEETVESYISSMTLKQKVGQLFIFGFSGKTIDKRLEKMMETYEPGSIIVFKRNIQNPDQLAKLNHQAQSLALKKSGLPLFIMVDQEGGVVSRIKTRPVSPSALSIGMTQNPAISETTGLITGKILRLLGFNMNLAPVVDISDPFQFNFIDNRSFGKEPLQVKNMSRRFASGLGKAGVIATLKHFPGHGGVVQDSHKTFPKKLSNEDELNKNDLVPFNNLDEFTYPSAVMVAHIAYPNVDPEGMPATFSKKLVTDILKKQLAYKGLIMTDDIEMFGAKAYKSVGERAVRAIEAGNDLVMVAWTRRSQRKAFKALYNAVMEGRVPETRINESLRKIISAKLDLNYVHPKKLELATIKQELKANVAKLKETTNLVTQRNMDRAFYGQERLKGSIPLDRRINVFSADWLFYKSFSKQVHNKTRFYPLSPRKTPPVETVLNREKGSIAVYYVTGSGTARILNRVGNAYKSRILVVNSTSPGRIVNRHLYKGVIDINSRNYNAGGWLAAYINGHDPKVRRPASKNVSLMDKLSKSKKKN